MPAEANARHAISLFLFRDVRYRPEHILKTCLYISLRNRGNEMSLALAKRVQQKNLTHLKRLALFNATSGPAAVHTIYRQAGLSTKHRQWLSGDVALRLRCGSKTTFD